MRGERPRRPSRSIIGWREFESKRTRSQRSKNLNQKVAAESGMIARDSDGATQVGAAVAEGGMIARDGDRAADWTRRAGGRNLKLAVQAAEQC